MAVGDEARLDSTRTIRVLSLKLKRYADGSPQEWVSTVAVTQYGCIVVSAFPIRVNSPLRLRGLSIYQASWTTEGKLDLAGPDGKRIVAATGEGFRHAGVLWYFARMEQGEEGWSAIFELWKGDRKIAERRAATGGTIGPFAVIGVFAREITGLKVVHDPGFPVVIGALIVTGAGFALSFLQKRGDQTV